MTKKNNSSKSKNVAKRITNAVKKTPLAKHPMQTIGNALGGKAGQTMGKIIGSIIGSGDYEVSNNSILTASSVFGDNEKLGHGPGPLFTKIRGGHNVTHREYIGDVISGGANTLI